MISDVHPADAHAPFPHKIVSGTGARITREVKGGKRTVTREEFSYEYIVCAICKHYVNGAEETARKCRCRATCHDTFVIPSE